MLQVRAQVSEHDGVAVIVKAMKHWAGSGGVQCNGCLAIVSLVRAESEVCQVRACPTLPRMLCAPWREQQQCCSSAVAHPQQQHSRLEWTWNSLLCGDCQVHHQGHHVCPVLKRGCPTSSCAIPVM